jgi:MFS family permease
MKRTDVDLLKNKNERTLILASVIISALIVDMTLSTFSDILQRQLATVLGILLFIIIIVAIFVGQYSLYGFVNRVTREVRPKILYFSKITSHLVIVQYVITSILLFMILQIVITSSYHVGLIIAATSISYTLATIIMTLLSYKFFSWYKSDKNITVLLYGLAGALVAISTGTHILTHNSILLEKLADIRQGSNLKTEFPDINPSTFGTLGWIFLYIYVTPLLLSFMLMYAGTAFLLYHYSEKIGKIKYWLVISLPLISIVCGMIPTLIAMPSGNFTFYKKNLVTYRIFTILSGTSGGILIGVGFLTIAINIRQINQSTSSVVNYITISAYGVIMQAICLETPIYQTPYPPFGIAASSFIALACYFYSLGVYSSAISVSQDMKLRQAIKKFAANQSKLLDSIGSAEMENEIQGRVIALTKRHKDLLEEETGVQSSLTEDDVKQYLEVVLKEIKKK